MDAIKGSYDGVPFHIHALKEPDYVMMLMSTYGTLAQLGEIKKQHFKVNGEKVNEFQYPMVVFNHYSYQDMIDNHNTFRMHRILMEET